MQRAIITVRGRVQKVGYRDFVAEIANRMDVVVMVENQPDGKSVKIIAEAEEEVLKDFVKLLWATTDPIIKVKNIDVVFEPPIGEYDFFDIVYDEFQKESFERIGEAVMHLKKLNAGQNRILEKQDIMIEKQDIIFDKRFF